MNNEILLPNRCHNFAKSGLLRLYSRESASAKIIPTRLRVLSHSYFSPYFRRISVSFPSNFLVFLCILCVLSPLGTVLVSKLGINFLKNRRRKIRYSFSVSDTWLCLTVQLASMFEYKEWCKGRAPWWNIFIITHFRQNYNYLAKIYNCHKCNFSANVKKSLQRTASPFC